jgi:hypothetical protein
MPAPLTEADAILRDLFKTCLAKPISGPRAFYSPDDNALRKAVEGAAQSAAAGDWKAFMTKVAELAASLGIKNPDEVAQRAAAIAQKA